MIDTLWILAGGVILIVIGAPFVSFDWFHDSHVEERIEAIVARQKGLEPKSHARASQSQISLLTRQIGELVAATGILSATNLAKIKETVRAAGFRDNAAYTTLIGAKIVGAIGLPVVFVLTALALHVAVIGAVIFGVVGFVLGLLAPEWALSIFRARYEAAIREALPDALDLLVICVDSGLGLESALNRVAVEIRESYPPLSAEMRITCQDLQINPDVEAALKGFATRLKIDGISRLVTTLVQSAVHGSPLSRSLHVLSREMRQDSLAAFEERASKLPTKMTIPMITFILPALMTIIVGPAIHGVLIALSHMSK